MAGSSVMCPGRTRTVRLGLADRLSGKFTRTSWPLSESLARCASHGGPGRCGGGSSSGSPSPGRDRSSDSQTDKPTLCWTNLQPGPETDPTVAPHLWGGPGPRGPGAPGPGSAGPITRLGQTEPETRRTDRLGQTWQTADSIDPIIDRAKT
jgi:hypothetical protein